MPKVSVIIPTHNRAALLPSAVSSVLNQTYRDFEVIVVDDGSTDNTREVMATFHDARIKYIRHDVNKGDAGSRNTGVRNSAGDFIAFLDDDDEWLPEKLRMQVDILQKSPAKVGAVYTGWHNIDKATGKILGIKTAGEKGDLFQEIFGRNFIVTPCILLRRECFDRIGFFDERMPCNSDYDMWIRVAEHFYFECIREPLVIVHYAQGPKLSTSLPLVIQGWEMLFEKYNKVFMSNTKFSSNKRRFSRFYYDVGILYCLNGESDKSRRALLKAIESYPLRVRYYLALIISLLGSGIFRMSIDSKEKISASLRNRKVTQELQRLAGSSLIPTVRVICRSGLRQ